MSDSEEHLTTIAGASSSTTKAPESESESNVNKNKTDSQNTDNSKLSKKERKALEFKQQLESKKTKKLQQQQHDKPIIVKEPKEKKNNKRDGNKKRKANDEGDGDSNNNTKEKENDKKVENNEDGTTSTKPKKKKRRKNKKKGGDDSSSTTTKDSGPRFILFVGNLPYKYELTKLEEHFQPASPDVIRPREGKGFAFIEFSGDDASRRLTIALSKLHHTDFMGRKINVELTAGGGGNTEVRKKKIQEKNLKLEESRKKEIEKEKLEKEQRKHIKFDDNGDSKEKDDDRSADIHPSRRRLLENN